MKRTICLHLLLWFSLFYEIYAKKHSNNSAKELDAKIVGGYNATIQDYPYQVYILMEKGGSYYQCGGSLISARYVLTAAHCLVGVTAVYVRTGSTDSDSGGNYYYTYFYRIHPLYNAATSDYDVALVDLRRNVQLDGTNTRSIPMIDQDGTLAPGTEITVSGWGTTAKSCFISFAEIYAKKHSNNSAKELDAKIVGGYNATIQDYPYQVYILMEKGGSYYQCGGSLISARYVLTAAHCLVGVTAVYVRTGSTDSDSGGNYYYTYFYRIHPLYNAATSDYDVALVDLRRNVQLDGTNTRSIPMIDQDGTLAPGTEITVSGWGTTAESGQTSNNLMAVRVPVVSTQDCRRAYGSARITTRMFCAGLRKGGKDSCQGDSGGPAAVDNGGRLVGIVSYGNGCARAGYPGVYTSVASVRAWIRTNSGV